MDTFFYFAYGSNMFTARLVDRCSSARALSAAFAPGYQVKFWKKSRDGSGKCTLVNASPEQTASGVLFEVNLNDLPALDLAEGRDKGYDRINDFAVRCADTGEIAKATTYIASILSREAGLNILKRQDNLVFAKALGRAAKMSAAQDVMM